MSFFNKLFSRQKEETESKTVAVLECARIQRSCRGGTAPRTWQAGCRRKLPCGASARLPLKRGVLSLLG